MLEHVPPRALLRRALTAALALVFALAPAAHVAARQQQGMGGPASPQPSPRGGVSTGAGLVSAVRRTAGITDPKAPRIFEDVTARTGLNSFRNRSGAPAKDYIVETVSAGVALFDYDGDGRLDIYLLNGSTVEAERGKEKPQRAALYRNLGDWKFEDVTAKAGVANERWGMGVAVGDYDNDGDPDLYVGNFGVSRLYRNNGNGTFTDVAERLGVARKGWSTGASFGDYDGDGRLDLFVPGYVELDLNNLPPSPADVGKPGPVAQNFCQFRGQPVMCGPRGLKGERDTLYRQKPDGTFEDVSDKTGVNDEPRYYGFSSVWVHANEDHLIDLLVVNDSTPKQLYMNLGGGKFEEVGYASGVALNENGREQAGMGLAVGDYDNDGRVDFYITNFSDDTNTLYHNDGEGNFTDVTTQAGMGEPTIPFLGWGTSFIDYDNDGWKDVFVANGHVYPAVDRQQWGTSWAQQPLLFANVAHPDRQQSQKGARYFQRVGAAPGSGLAEAWPSRGLAVGDLDDDGRPDIVLNNIDAPPTVLRNVAETKNRWLRVRLVGDPARNSPRDAAGALVYVTAGGLRQRGDVVSGAGYSSQNDPALYFGLGAAEKVDRLEVRWPGGQTETFDVPGLDRTVTLTQGKGGR
ncbi:MAG TPA: CRTAC1 family protein [Pyrinomonadaceae bacterium]|nr:CRTAC1 family protein [Pyrinomonadaceae bacterium]